MMAWLGDWGNWRRVLLVILLATLAGCGGAPTAPTDSASAGTATRRPEVSERGQEVMLFALGLIDTGYRFGGKNPSAGLDCSGMVSYVFDKAIGYRVSGSAADIARQGRPINRDDLRPGDLVFFNTRNAPFSHVGLYIGDDRFIHAPSTNGRVRIDLLSTKYYAQRYDAARAYFD